MATRKRKPQVVWMPEEDGYLWWQFTNGSRRATVAEWCAGGKKSWAEWRKDRPTLRVVKVQLTEAK